MKQKSNEYILSKPIEIPYFGTIVEVIGVIMKENRVESFRAKKNKSFFYIPNREDKDFVHKAFVAKIKKYHPEYFL